MSSSKLIERQKKTITMKNILLIIVAITSFLSVSAQTGIVKGQLIDATGAPQEFANVLLVNSADSVLIKGLVTEEGGAYLFDKLEPGSYMVTASMVGYADTYSPIINSNNDEIVLENLVLHEGVVLDQVTLVATKPFIEMKADKIIVNVENSAVNSGNSALEILEKSPGVTVDKDNNISLRGKQGVLVLINGKNQYMTGDELSGLLESMPAENIQNIEIITNPSAKYDAEGNSGIINIRLRKNSNLGVNGSVNAGARHGRKFSNNIGGDINYRAEKVNVYGSVRRSEWAGFQDLNLKRVIPFNNGLTTFDQKANGNDEEVNYSGKIGIDYMLSDKTTIGVLFKSNREDDIDTNSNCAVISGTNAPAFDILNVELLQNELWTQNAFNFNVVHNFDDKGTTLSFDTDYSAYNKDIDSQYDNNYFDLDKNPVALPFILRNNEVTDINIFASMLDFTKSYESGYTVEIGAKLSMVETDNDTRFTMLQDENWVEQAGRSNQFVYNEDVLAVYANVSKSLGKVNLQGGLRMERTSSEGVSMTIDNTVKRDYTDLFPSLSLSHPIGENHNLSYSYSRRLNRPNYKDLNPFIEYLDQYTFEKGNPFLNPQYADAFGINYGYKNKFFVSANYSHTSDAITEIIEQVSEENQTFATNVNLDIQNSASLTVSTSVPWKELGVSRVNVTAFYNEFKSVIPSGILDNKNLAYNIYLGNEFNLPKDITMELNFRYTSDLTYGLFKIQSRHRIDLGFSKDIMKGRANVMIGIDDIFRTNNNVGMIRQDDIILDLENRWDTRRAKVNFKYKFGNNKVKGARRRTTATEDESSRISN